MIRFAVVVKTFDSDLAIPGRPLFEVTGERTEATGWMEPVKPIPPELMLFRLRQPVFDLGEIILLGEHDREVDGPQRKPDKWSVEVEMFNNVDDAVARSQQVQSA